jgi:hypothetical protein
VICTLSADILAGAIQAAITQLNEVIASLNAMLVA